MEYKFNRLLENCDRADGVILNCSMIGGTGSGFTTLFLDRVSQLSMLNKKTLIINSVVPSPTFSDTIVEPYNFTMCLGDLIDVDLKDKIMVNYNN